MAKSKHIISKAKAAKLIKQFAEGKAAKKSPYKVLPDGFMIPAEDVRRILEHPDAAFLVIQFGLKVTTKAGQTSESITPVFCTAKADYTIIEGRAKSESGEGTAKMTAMTGTPGDEGTEAPTETGDYLDEVQHWPPPKN